MKKQDVFIGVLSLFCIGMLIAFPEKYLPSFSNGLNLFCIAVLPSMFPFFFFAKLLTLSDFSRVLDRAARKPLKKLYNAPPAAGYIFTVSILSGYPVGAKLVSDCYASGIIDRDEARTISSFCSTSGPLFIIGTVGTGMFGDKLVGAVLLLSHLIGALLNGFLYKNKSSGFALPQQPSLPNAGSLLEKAALSSVMTVAVVGSYIALFNLFFDILSDVKLIEVFASALSRFSLPYSVSEGVICSLVEVTRGCGLLSKSGLSKKIITPICCGVISFGGLSVAVQSMTFLSYCKLPPSHYFLSKLTQATFSFLVAAALSALLL